jgi:hypothetical protein
MKHIEEVQTRVRKYLLRTPQWRLELNNLSRLDEGFSRIFEIIKVSLG